MAPSTATRALFSLALGALCVSRTAAQDHSSEASEAGISSECLLFDFILPVGRHLWEKCGWSHIQVRRRGRSMFSQLRWSCSKYSSGLASVGGGVGVDTRSPIRDQEFRQQSVLFISLSRTERPAAP